MIVLGFMLISPLITRQRELSQQLDTVESLKATDIVVLTSLSKAREEIHQLRTQEVVRCERASSHNDETSFLEWADRQSKETKLEVRDFRPSNRETHGDYITRTVVLSAQGSYESICLFLDSLRQCPYMLRVTSLEILPRDQNRSMFGATFNIQLFTAKPQQASSPVNQG